MQQPQHHSAQLQQQQQLDIGALHRYLHRTLKQHRLASFTAQLLRDAITVALGIKPAAMLDFHLPPTVLDLILQHMHASSPALFAPLTLLTLGAAAEPSAVFLLSRPSFSLVAASSRRAAAAVPLVDISPGLTSPLLLRANEAACAALVAELDTFTTRLAAALDAEAAAVHVQLDAPPARCLPTLCGWLLGYPVVYAFPSSTDLPSHNALSQQPLTLVTLLMQSTERLAAAGTAFGGEDGGVVLQSFSVPSALATESVVVVALHAWEKRVGEACNDERVAQWVERVSVCRTAVCLPHVSL